MDNIDYGEINRLMAERRARTTAAKENYVRESKMDFNEANDNASRLTDLINAIVALPPNDIRAIGELTGDLWSSSDRDRTAFLANLRAIQDAAANTADNAG